MNEETLVDVMLDSLASRWFTNHTRLVNSHYCWTNCPTERIRMHWQDYSAHNNCVVVVVVYLSWHCCTPDMEWLSMPILFVCNNTIVAVIS